MDKINQLFIETLKKAEQEGKNEYVFAAIWGLMKEIQEFSQMGFLKSLIYEIALKKINFLMNAKTKSEVKEILRPSNLYITEMVLYLVEFFILKKKSCFYGA